MGILSALMRLGRRAAPAVDEAVPMPLRPPRQVGPGGMTIRPAEPMKRSFQGGSEDLMEAARITVVLVVDAGQRLLGAISINDLMRAKVI